MLEHCARIVIRLAAIIFLAALMVFVSSAPRAAAQTKADSVPKSCPGLHGGITAQLLPVYFRKLRGCS